jgi:hypothetical protein
VNDLPIIQVILILVAIGVILWLVNEYVPMQATIKKILNIAVVVLTLIWLLDIVGVFTYFSGVHVGPR